MRVLFAVFPTTARADDCAKEPWWAEEAGTCAQRPPDEPVVHLGAAALPEGSEAA